MVFLLKEKYSDYQHTDSPVFNICDFCCVIKMSYTLNRYTSEDFTSIFNEKSQPYSSANYTDLVMEEEQVVEEVIMVESEIIMDVSSTGALYFLYCKFLIKLEKLISV